MSVKKGSIDGIHLASSSRNTSSLSLEELLRLLEEGAELEETDLLEEAGFEEADLAFQELAARAMSGKPLHSSTDWVSDTGDTL